METNKYLIVAIDNMKEDENFIFSALDDYAKKREITFLPEKINNVVEARDSKVILLKIDVDSLKTSGNIVLYWLYKENIPISNLLVIVPNRAIPFGKLKVRDDYDGKPNMSYDYIKQIDDTLRTRKYLRIYAGTRNPHANQHYHETFDLYKRNRIDFFQNKLLETIESFIESGKNKAMQTGNKILHYSDIVNEDRIRNIYTKQQIADNSQEFIDNIYNKIIDSLSNVDEYFTTKEPISFIKTKDEYSDLKDFKYDKSYLYSFEVESKFKEIKSPIDVYVRLYKIENEEDNELFEKIDPICLGNYWLFEIRKHPSFGCCISSIDECIGLYVIKRYNEDLNKDEIKELVYRKTMKMLDGFRINSYYNLIYNSSTIFDYIALNEIDDYETKTFLYITYYLLRKRLKDEAFHSCYVEFSKLTGLTDENYMSRFYETNFYKEFKIAFYKYIYIRNLGEGDWKKFMDFSHKYGFFAEKSFLGTYNNNVTVFKEEYVKFYNQTVSDIEIDMLKMLKDAVKESNRPKEPRIEHSFPDKGLITTYLDENGNEIEPHNETIEWFGFLSKKNDDRKR